MFRKPFFFFCVLACPLSCGAPTDARNQERLPPDTAQIARLEQQLEELRWKLHIPALSAAIVERQRLRWSKGFGYADVERKTPATPETNYRIASLTKTFASTLLMQLVEQGKLDLDTPIAKLAPEFQQRFENDAITIRHVFTHTSHDNPGESYRYDGNRFSYLTRVIETASGMPFRGLLVKNILDKIEMSGSVPGQDVLDDRAKWPELLDDEHARRYEHGLALLAKPYRLYGSEIVQAISPPRGISASAGLVSNVVDLAKYDAAVDRHTFIKTETQEQAWTPAKSQNGNTLPYGLGWFIQRAGGTRLVWHYGYWPDSFSSLYLKVPEKNISFILLANSDGLSAPFRLGNGNVTRSAFADLFLRAFVFQDTNYESEATMHDAIGEWLAARRAATRNVVAVDPKIYAAYAGQYQLESGESFTITHDAGKLFVTLFGSRVELFPEAADRFFAKAVEIQLAFEKRDNGKIAGAGIQLPGRRGRATKVD